ncbi:MAG: DNA polymerase III subunit gamma/tau [Candidatus Omnitrophica bacterium]|nr:DNA polymerase III subunit gamma/tau [Candidatus Omnitrophota bacterium]
MPYTVFALKWRPKNFDEIVGQDHITTQLKSAIEKDRLAHAYLFAGPRGVGKTSTARILAKALNCQNGPTAHPCGTCPSCVEIAKGSSLDVLEIDGASNRGIDEIRTLRENVKFAPAQGRFKVYIIDEVHQITTDGFNALLKTLEEPPEFVKFIFATTHAHKVPPTIVSPCQRLDFRRISVMEIIQQLEKIVAAEKLKVDRDVLVAIARSSDGALRDAESVLDQLIAFAKDRVSHDDVISMLGLVEQAALFALTDRIIAHDAKGALELLNEIINQGKDMAILLSNLIEHFRNLMVAKVAKADSELIDLPQNICEKLMEQAASLSMEQIFSAFTVLMQAQDMSKRLDSMRIPLEISLVRLCQPKQAVASAKPLSAATHNSPPSLARPAPQQAKPVAPAPTRPVQYKPAPPRPGTDAVREKPQEPRASAGMTTMDTVSLETLKEGWQRMIEDVSRVKISVASYLNEGAPCDLSGNELTIVFPRNCSLHKETLEEKINRNLIEKKLAELFHAGLKLNFVLSQEEKNPEDSLHHPIVQSAMDMFNARVIKEG